MVEILKKYGKDHHNVKGGFLSVAVWSVLYNFGQRIGFYRMNPRLIKSSYSAIWHHLIFGFVTSNAIVALADPSIFSKQGELHRWTRGLIYLATIWMIEYSSGNTIVPLGYGKFVRSDKIIALEPIEEDRGPGRRTRVYVEEIHVPLVASRTENCCFS